MPLVVADTSPLVYLILIESIEILPQLFESVIIPDAVRAELCHRLAPEPVRIWAEAPRPDADLVLIDERKGTQIAIENGLPVSGTLGILQRAARKRVLNLADAFDRLKKTNFRYRQEILDQRIRDTTP